MPNCPDIPGHEKHSPPCGLASEGLPPASERCGGSGLLHHEAGPAGMIGGQLVTNPCPGCPDCPVPPASGEDEGERWTIRVCDCGVTLGEVDATDRNHGGDPGHCYREVEVVPASTLTRVKSEIQHALSDHGTYSDLVERLNAIVEGQ